MRRLASLALGTSILAFGSGLAPAPAVAQRGESVLQINGRSLALSRLEMDRLGEVRSVLHGAAPGVQDRALRAARSVVNSTDARYVLALYQLEIGQQRRDDPLRAEALDVLIASRDTPAEKIPDYLAIRGDIAFRNRDYAVASSAWTRVAELRPDDPQSLNNLAQLRNVENDPAAAVDLMARAIAAHQSRAQVAPENWYRQWLSIAYNGHLVEQGAAAAHALITAYPTPANWRLGLVAFRQLAPPQEGAEIDLLRLMHVAGALTQPAEYQRFAQLLRVAGLPVEGKAALEEGVSRGVVSRRQSPTREILAELDRAIARPPAARPSSPSAGADLLFGQARYAEAASAYRAALRSAGADAAPLSLRLGMALSLAGRRDEAGAAYRALVDAPAGGAASLWYADLARFGLVWLAQPADAAQTVTR